MSRFDRRGVALMLVLWVIVILGAAATEIAARTRAATDVVRNVRARVAARYAAESGLLAAATRLEDLLASARTPADAARTFRELDRRFAGMQDVAVGESRFGVVIADLNARIDLNHADEPTLRNFFQEFVGPSRADPIVAALEDWEDPDDVVRPGGAEVGDYARAGSPYVPRNGPLQRVAEFAHVLGVPDTLALIVAPYVTVDGDGRININTAPEPVLAALPGVGSEGARVLLSRRERGEVFTSTHAIDELLRSRAGVNAALALSRVAIMPSRLLVVSRGWVAGHPLTHEIEAVYAVVGGRLALRAWRERDL